MGTLVFLVLGSKVAVLVIDRQAVTLVFPAKLHIWKVRVWNYCIQIQYILDLHNNSDIKIGVNNIPQTFRLNI